MTRCLALAALFPPNGLDRSLHVAVLVGVAWVTFFAETLGWNYGGLVVPGYLATLLVAAPVTAALMSVEALLTHFAVWVVARLIPVHSRAWSTFFGRERFFLYIVMAVLVRLGVEAHLVPWAVAQWPTAHSRELYSVGLVLVPLMANSFWNSGVRYAAPRLAVISLLTYAVLAGGLLRYTNYSVSRFQIANESLGLQFPDSPKAYLILLCGSLLAARGTVLYGWDYNGILVPALLATTWYQPTKLLSTVVEAIIVYLIAKSLSSVWPLNRLLLVGPRRLLWTVIVGFIVKLVLGHVLAARAPQLLLVDYLGFGYILPSLLAVKIWNRERIGQVLMPTLQVSVMAFLLGNGLGYGLRWVRQQSAFAAPTAVASIENAEQAGFELVLGNSAPHPASRRPLDIEHAAFALGAPIAKQIQSGQELSPSLLESAQRAGLVVSRDPNGWLTLRPKASENEDDLQGPRLALGPKDALSWLVLVLPRSQGSALPVVGYKLGQLLQAQAVVLLSPFPDWRQQDEHLAEAVSTTLGTQHVLLLEEKQAPGASLEAYGAVPSPLSVDELEKLLGKSVSLTWRAAPSGDDSLTKRAYHLAVDEPLAEASAAKLLFAPEPQRWTGSVHSELQSRLLGLTSTGGDGYRPPKLEELRLFGQVLQSALAPASPDWQPSLWQRAVARQLGYQFVRFGPEDKAPLAWGLIEPESESRHGHASWIGRPLAASTADPILVEVPAPRWEVGTLMGGFALFEGLSSQGFLISGAMPHADASGLSDVRHAEGRHSYYQRMHELWLQSRRPALSVQGIVADRATDEDVVLSIGRELVEWQKEPEWLNPVRNLFEEAGYKVGKLDGTRPHVAFAGAGDPTMGFAERFAQDRYALVWMSPKLRSILARRSLVQSSSQSLGGPKRRPVEKPIAAYAWSLLQCKAPGQDCPKEFLEKAGCNLDQAQQWAERLTQEHNPFDRALLTDKGKGCHVEYIRDSVTQINWTLIASQGQIRLIPFHGVPVLHQTPILKDKDALQRAAALATSTIRLGTEP